MMALGNLRNVNRSLRNMSGAWAARDARRRSRRPQIAAADGAAPPTGGRRRAPNVACGQQSASARNGARDSRLSTAAGSLGCRHAMPAAEPRGRSPVTARRGRLVLHVLSDSTGETASAAASAVLSQFDGLEVRRRQHVFVRAPRDVDAALARIGEEPGVVVYTLTDAALAVALLDPFFEAVADETGAERSLRPGRQHGIGGSYFARVAAMDYAMTQDDGATPDRLRRADVVLLGVSRTSKTPTCLYLAVRGVKAANVPLVPGRALPEGLDAALAAGVPGH